VLDVSKLRPQRGRPDGSGRKPVDLRGRQFGRLTAIRLLGLCPKSGAVIWMCRCSCHDKTEKPVRALVLLRGGAQSCGCLQREGAAERRFRHGHAGPSGGRESAEYRTWASMWARCTNPNNVGYKDYGGRGIEVCARWKDFAAFLSDMGHKPRGPTLDREDPNGNYKPGNCRWASRSQQARNTRKARLLTLGGRTQHLHDWAKELSIPPDRIYARLRLGWSDEDALTQKTWRRQ